MEEREFGIILESIDFKVKHGVGVTDEHTQELSSLKGVPATLEKIDTRLDAIETILESVNMPVLKQKVASLEKQIEELEKAR